MNEKLEKQVIVLVDIVDNVNDNYNRLGSDLRLTFNACGNSITFSFYMAGNIANPKIKSDKMTLLQAHYYLNAVSDYQRLMRAV